MRKKMNSTSPLLVNFTKIRCKLFCNYNQPMVNIFIGINVLRTENPTAMRLFVQDSKYTKTRMFSNTNFK